MHAVVPIFSLVGQLATELNESGNRKRRGEKFVGMLAKAKHQTRVQTSGISTGELEKHDPLPLGRYWIDVFKPKPFGDWLAKQDPKNVVILNTEFFGDSDPIRYWYLFEVKTMPVAWGIELAKEIGWPTIAGPDVQTSDDTVQKPKAEDTLPWWQGGNQGSPPGSGKWWDDLPAGWKVAIVGGGVLILAIGVGYAIRSFR